MSRSTFSRTTGLVVLLSCFVSMTFAGAENEPTTVVDQAKQKAEAGLHWTADRCDAMRQEWKETIGRGKVKGQLLVDDVRDRAYRAWQKVRATNAPVETVRIGESNSSEILEAHVPYDLSAEAITPAEPVTRTVITVTEQEINGHKQITAIDIEQQRSWLAWLETEEGARFGKGAIAVITVAGVTYVLYKNQVPQRIYGYVVENPVKSFFVSACALGVAVYVAQSYGVTVQSLKNKVCIPSNTL